MKSKTHKTKYNLYSLLQLKAILVGAAIFNYIAAYAAAKSVDGLVFCYGQPWYTVYRFGDFPFFLLIATLSLYIGRWWSNLFSIFFCLPIIYEFAIYCTGKNAFSILLDQFEDEPTLALQIAFAFAILTLAVASLTKTILRRKPLKITAA